MNKDLDYLFELFGDHNEELDNEDLSDLMEEIRTLEDEDLLDVTCESISCGKWQILGCILEEKEERFGPKQITIMKAVLEDYMNDDEEDDLELQEMIGEKMESLISQLEHIQNSDKMFQRMSLKKRRK